MLTYFLEVTVMWSIMGLLYLTFFRHKTFYSVNRGYLLFSVIGGLLLPLLTAHLIQEPLIELNLERATVIAGNQLEGNQEDVSTAVENALIPTSLVFWVIYGIGAILLFLRLTKSLIDIYRLITNVKLETTDDYKLISHTEVKSPFSFFNYMFIPQVTMAPEELDQIRSHELVHIRGYHSIDVMLLQIIRIFIWFHPMIWIFQYWIREVHEFEADDIACLQTSKKAYGLLLMEEALSYSQPRIANHFYNNQLKKRIEMMYKTKTSKAKLSQYLLVIPALMLSVMLIGQSNGNEGMDPVLNPEENIELDTFIVYNPNTYEEQMFVAKFFNKDHDLRVPLRIASGVGEFGETGVTVTFGNKKIERKFRIKSLDGKTDISKTTNEGELMVKLPVGVYKVRVDEGDDKIYTTIEVKK